MNGKKQEIYFDKVLKKCVDQIQKSIKKKNSNYVYITLGTEKLSENEVEILKEMAIKRGYFYECKCSIKQILSDLITEYCIDGLEGDFNWWKEDFFSLDQVVIRKESLSWDDISLF